MEIDYDLCRLPFVIFVGTLRIFVGTLRFFAGTRWFFAATLRIPYTIFHT